MVGALGWRGLAWGAEPTPAPPSTPAAPAAADQDDLEVPVTRPAPPVVPPATVAAPTTPTEHAELEELRARLSALEAAEKAREATAPSTATRQPVYAPAEKSEAPKKPTTSFDASPWSREYARGFGISGYVQAQYQHSQLSADQVDANGDALNKDTFLVRRARLRVEQGWDFAYADLEIDGNNVDGLAIGLRRAEATLLWRGPGSGVPWRQHEASKEVPPSSLPPVVFTVGLTDVPFGYEMMEPNRLRLFLERTQGSRAFFPGDAAFGAKISGAVGFFRYALGAYDGNPVPDSSPKLAGVDFSAAKDLMGRFGAETQPRDDLGVSGGVSFIKGTGFHQGTAATKGTLEWTDTNGNGTIDSGEVTGLPAQAATPSKTFGRWALGVDLQLRVKTPIGRGLLYGEAYVGNDYDRGLFVADPITTGVDLREVGWYAAYVQEVTRFGIVGLRVEQYNPNADATTQRAGSILPVDQTITTWSPLVGIVLPERARLMFEYDRVLNNQGITPAGVPTTLKSDVWVLRLQVQI
jgi:hypothetical protein